MSWFLPQSHICRSCHLPACSVPGHITTASLVVDNSLKNCGGGCGLPTRQLSEMCPTLPTFTAVHCLCIWLGCLRNEFAESGLHTRGWHCLPKVQTEKGCEQSFAMGITELACGGQVIYHGCHLSHEYRVLFLSFSFFSSPFSFFLLLLRSTPSVDSMSSHCLVLLLPHIITVKHAAFLPFSLL